MEFDVDSDPETLIELFGVDDAESLGECVLLWLRVFIQKELTI